MLGRMNLRTLVVVGLLVAAAFALSSALITHDGVGAVEWVVGIVVVAGLLLLAAQKSRRALTRG
jgi:drug/metabolite transporter (DMT)-like permease